MPIQSALALQMLNRYWSESLYTSETNIGAINNGANVYMWSFGADPIATVNNAVQYSSRSFYGNEQLILNFNSSLAAAVQVDVCAICNSVLEQGPSWV